MKELSLMVKKKRGDLGLRAAADQIGITHTTLSRVESGKLPDLNTFTKICNWLGVQPNEILGFSSSRTSKAVAALPVAHYRAKKTMGPETAQHLAELIIKVHEAVGNRSL
jgi:DNA-binding Xre family transcriptional regulator